MCFEVLREQILDRVIVVNRYSDHILNAYYTFLANSTPPVLI